MKTISRWSFRLLKWLILIVVVSWLITRLDHLWPWAVESTYERIRDDSDFESRLVRYAVLGQRGELVLKAVAPGSQTLWDIISVAKSRDNTWRLLTRTLENKASGTGIALDALSIVIERAAKLADSFEDVQQLTEVASASTSFRLGQNQASLVIFGEQCGGPGAQALSNIRIDLDTLAANVRSLNLNFTKLMADLSQTANSGGLDAELARMLHSSLLSLRQPLIDFDHDVQSLRSDVAEDVGTMQSIHWRVVLVSTADEILTKISFLPRIREWARTVWDNLRLAFYLGVALVVAGIAFNLGDWYDRRRATHKKPEIRVVMQQPPAPQQEQVRRRVVEPRNVEPSESHPPRKPPVRRVQQAAPPAAAVASVERRALGGSLVPQSGHGAGQPIPLPSHGKVTLGSGPGNEVKVADTAASPYHASISAARTCYFVQDLDSTGGTFVNGERLSGARRLQSGDVISIGSEEFTFAEGS